MSDRMKPTDDDEAAYDPNAAKKNVSKINVRKKW
jgi:hypothetical protein